MSADNGVYILKTKDQYRVAHLQAIDNLTWSAISSDEIEKEYSMNRYVPTRIVEMWGKCKYTKNRKIAYDIAHRIACRLPVCEYGVNMIAFDKTWKNILQDAKNYAKREIESLRKNGEKNVIVLTALQKIADGDFL